MIPVLCVPRVYLWLAASPSKDPSVMPGYYPRAENLCSARRSSLVVVPHEQRIHLGYRRQSQNLDY